MRLRFGHIPPRKVTFLMGLTSTPYLEICDVVEDVENVLKECAQNQHIRDCLLSDKLMDFGRCNIIMASPMTDTAKVFYDLYTKY